MPFMGKDWRSPGEAWVKTENLGWQRMKIIESQLYPSCHQNPACSWPPRSEFGQHMANHCKRHDCNDANSSEFRNSLSSGNSSDGGSNSSRGDSMSPSPTGSPEKNVHQIYPITISSPYGQYSCCNHHLEHSSPNKNYYEQKIDNSQLNAQTMSRSLSRELLRIDRKTTTSQKLRYNNSVSNFRYSTPANEQHFSNGTHASQNNSSKDDQVEIENHQSDELNSPILMQNGYKLEELGSSGTEQVGQINISYNHKSKQNQNSQTNACCCTNSQGPKNIYHPKEPYVRTAPHCRISVRTREVAMYNTISEAFYRLDFCNAIHDIRRFNYICKLLHLLITQNLTSLSGCATKVLFTMLEQVAWEVSSNKRNIHVLKNLLNELRQMIQKYYCWGRPIGSKLLWQQHFDTIERISQIVEGIELSPPNQSDTAQTTFNNLPVEMIREILLRLNDYRDLVNLAQASPVMRTMIDGQYIWHQLCRYHFTEQQLKLAFDNNNGLFIKKTTRGVKYARTVSADGRTIFRNPVTHKSKNNLTTSKRQQLEQTSRSRNSSHKDIDNELDSSYVTRAIRIFDKEGSSMTLGSSRVKMTKPEDLRRVEQCSSDILLRDSQNFRSDRKGNQDASQKNHSSQASHEIDWEHVFHQLRKKFDLKEEYADCLLLCRHCRCLFWKSFGHPCIKNDDLSVIDGQCSSFRFDQQCSVVNNSNLAQNICNCDRLDRQRRLISQERQEPLHRNEHDQVQNRPSVAALSRNFDNRAQGMSRVVDIENLPPELNALNRHHVRQSLNQRLSNNNLDARNLRVANGRPNEANNNNLPTARPSIRRDELVPKHVTISPQAFLKFFSL